MMKIWIQFLCTSHDSAVVTYLVKGVVVVLSFNLLAAMVPQAIVLAKFQLTADTAFPDKARFNCKRNRCRSGDQAAKETRRRRYVCQEGDAITNKEETPQSLLGVHVRYSQS